MERSASFLEQDTGVEPAFTAWEAVVLPIYESCIERYCSTAKTKIQPIFVERFQERGWKCTCWTDKFVFCPCMK